MPPKPRKIFLTATAREDLVFWEQTNLKIIQKINAILASILVDPASGIGKPEKLKYLLSGMWSRRLDHRHRIVYEIQSDSVIVLQLRDHY
jgi:toxin YoeB